MPTEQQIAAPAQLARIEFVSPWRTTSPASAARARAGRWLALLADAWREGMELYVRAGMFRSHGGWFG